MGANSILINTEVAIMNKGFLSYCHEDEIEAKKLLKFLDPLKESNIVDVWFDRMIRVGDRWNDDIQNHFNESNVFVFCITSGFLSSSACRDELNRAIEARRRKHISIILVILKACQWKEIRQISELQVVPRDGLAIMSWPSIDEGYNDACKKIKKEIETLNNICSVRFTDDFLADINDIGSVASISGALSADLKLLDLFVYPSLRVHMAKDGERRFVSAETLSEMMVEEKCVQLIGAEQSGKTSLCKKLCIDLMDKAYFPVLLAGADRHAGTIENRIERRIKTAYNNGQYVDRDRIVLILDDFHRARKPGAILKELEAYKRIIIVVDDLYGLDISNSAMLNRYAPYEIIPLGAKKRDELIQKWIDFQRHNLDPVPDNYQKLDLLTEHVNIVLGKTFGRGVMPSYPFFVLSIIAVVDVAGHQNIQQEITSQGYCYQALVYLSLRKATVKPEEMDAYIHFLTSLAYDTFIGRKDLAKDELEAYYEEYCSRYNLLVEFEELLARLANARIFKQNAYGLYGFTQRYMQYYFTAKYFAEHQSEVACKSEYDKLMGNLCKSSNAYVAVFMAHHSRNITHLENLSAIAESMLPTQKPCFLCADDVRLIEQHIGNVVSATLPDRTESPASTREKILAKREELEDVEYEDEAHDESFNQILNAIRVSEVLGQILKARSGSIELEKMRGLVSQIIVIHAKLIGVFVESLAAERQRTAIINSIEANLRKRKVKDRGWTDSQMREFASRIFWDLIFMVVFAITHKCITAVGSEQLYRVVVEVCNEASEPLKKVVPYGVGMFYCKRCVPKDILKCLQSAGMTETAKWMLKQLVSLYAFTHKIDFNTRNEIENLLGLKRTISSYVHAEGA